MGLATATMSEPQKAMTSAAGKAQEWGWVKARATAPRMVATSARGLVEAWAPE